MPFDTEQGYKKLDTYIIDFRQSIVLIKDEKNNDKFYSDYRNALSKKEKIIYVDLRNINSAKKLAEQLLEQYKYTINEKLEIALPEDGYRALDSILELFIKAEEIDKNIVIWMENFTDLLAFKEDWIFELLRGVFQHHDNIVHVFTSDNKNDINTIFYNSDNPFFRFAHIK